MDPTGVTAFCLPASPCTASGWLARVLNAHPDVFCAHDLGARARWQVEPLAAVDVDPTLTEDPVVAYFLALLLPSGYRAVGDVNGVAHADWCRAMPRLRAVWPAFRAAMDLDAPDEIELRSAYLVRHPVLQCASYARIEAQNARAGRVGESLGIEVLRDIRQRRGLRWAEDDLESWAFFAACEQIAALVAHAWVDGMPLFRMEDCTTEPGVVGRLLCTLGVDVPLDAATLAHVMGAVANRHRPAGAPRDPEAVHAGWTDLEREIFARAFDGRARAIAAAAGYRMPGETADAAEFVSGEGIDPPPPPSLAEAAREFAGSPHRSILVLGSAAAAARAFVAARAHDLDPVLVHEGAPEDSPLPAVRPAALGEDRWRSRPVLLAGSDWRGYAARVAAVGPRSRKVYLAVGD